MNNKLKLLFLALAGILSLASCAQSGIIIPSPFVQTEPPTPYSNEWSLLNQSNNEFEVRNIQGNLEIQKTKEVNRCELKLPNGALIGIDNGEWGGQLKYIPNDTTAKIVEIKGGNIKFIFAFKDKIYFIEGLAHMTYTGGALYRLDIVNNKFSCAKIISFDDAPEAFTIYKDKMLIASYENFYIVEDFKPEVIIKKAFWAGLYPNSIAVFDDKNVFIGMRSGITKLDLTTKTLVFYKNN